MKLSKTIYITTPALVAVTSFNINLNNIGFNVSEIRISKISIFTGAVATTVQELSSNLVDSEVMASFINTDSSQLSKYVKQFTVNKLIQGLYTFYLTSAFTGILSLEVTFIQN